MKNINIYIKESFYKNIGRSVFEKNYQILKQALSSESFKNRYCNSAIEESTITFDDQKMEITFKWSGESKKMYCPDKGELLFDLNTKDNAERLCECDLDKNIEVITLLYSNKSGKRGDPVCLNIMFKNYSSIGLSSIDIFPKK